MVSYELLTSRECLTCDRHRGEFVVVGLGNVNLFTGRAVLRIGSPLSQSILPAIVEAIGLMQRCSGYAVAQHCLVQAANSGIIRSIAQPGFCEDAGMTEAEKVKAWSQA